VDKAVVVTISEEVFMASSSSVTWARIRRTEATRGVAPRLRDKARPLLFHTVHAGVPEGDRGPAEPAGRAGREDYSVVPGDPRDLRVRVQGRMGGRHQRDGRGEVRLDRREL